MGCRDSGRIMIGAPSVCSAFCQHVGRNMGTSRACGPCLPGVPHYMVETDTSLRTSALARCG